MTSTSPLPFVLRGEFIPLDALLKAASLCSSGGAAKMLIVDGGVQVDGVVETRRTRKLRAGQRVDVGGVSILVQADADADADAEAEAEAAGPA